MHGLMDQKDVFSIHWWWLNPVTSTSQYVGYFRVRKSLRARLSGNLFSTIELGEKNRIEAPARPLNEPYLELVCISLSDAEVHSKWDSSGIWRGNEYGNIKWWTPTRNNYESDYKAGPSLPCARNYTTICTQCRRHMDCGVNHIWIIAWICITVTMAKHNYSVCKMMECKVRSMWRGEERRHKSRTMVINLLCLVI